MKISSFAKIILTILCVKVTIASMEKFDTTCQKYGDKFQVLESGVESDWVLKDAFEKGIYLKKTTLEALKYVHFPGNEPEFVLVRRTLKKNFDFDQMKVVYNMGKQNAGPKVFGCQHGKENGGKDTFVYVVKEPFHRVLEYSSTRAFFRSAKRSEVLKLYADLFSDLQTLHKMGQSGHIHNNVSPLSVFTDEKVTNLYLTGYNMMQTKSENIQDAGVPLVMAPTRFMKNHHPSIQDDWYSVALLIANMESKKGYDDVFTGNNESDEFKPIDLACLKGEWTEECKEKLAENVTRILQGAGYGEFMADAKLLNHEDEMNFTTLLTHMVHHDNNLSEQRISESMKRYIEEAEKIESEGNESMRVGSEEERSTLQEEFAISANDFNDALEEANILLRDLTAGKALSDPDPRIEITERLQTLILTDVSHIKEGELFKACPELFFRRKTKANVRGNYEGDVLPNNLEGVYEEQQELMSTIKNSIQKSSGNKITQSEVLSKLSQNIVSSVKKDSVNSKIASSMKDNINSKVTSSMKNSVDSKVNSSMKNKVDSQIKTSSEMRNEKQSTSMKKSDVSSSIKNSNVSSVKKETLSSPQKQSSTNIKSSHMSVNSMQTSSKGNLNKKILI